MTPPIVATITFMYFVCAMIMGGISGLEAGEPAQIVVAKMITWPYFFVRYVKRGFVRAVKDF